MKWSIFNSLKKRYTALTLIIAVLMLAFNLFKQNEINAVKENIQSNIQSRNLLFQQSRNIKNTLGQFRDVVYEFQINPGQFENPNYISSIISKAVIDLEGLSAHPWIKENYHSTVSELINTINDFKNISQRLIKIRLTPRELFPSLKIANSDLQPISAKVIEKLNLTIESLEQNNDSNHQKEYKLLLEIRYHWVQMISEFRMYMLNRLNSFQESFLVSQLHLISERQNILKSKLFKLNQLNQKKQLNFNTSLIVAEISVSVYEWIRYYKRVQKINTSGEWRTDTIIFNDELKPKLKKITTLLRILDVAIEKFSNTDIESLSNIAQNQVNSLWTTTLMGFFVLLSGFIYLVKLILNPIADVTKALEDEAKGIDTKIQTDNTILETKTLISAFSDMRQQIHFRQTELEYHALHDSLTGLANRHLLNDRIQQAIHNAQQERTSFAILIMDLDRFKEVNDTLGHAIGDLLLQKVAYRLSTTMREADVIVRLGGDEFAILLNIAHRKDAEIIAKKITKEFQEVFLVNEISLYIGISIGVSLYPDHGTSLQTLIQHADIAMYVAKRNKTGYEIYDAKYDEHSLGKLSLASDIRTAIDNEQLFLKYQPVIDLKTKKVISAEALLRWNHPELGEISPDEIIPVAEQTGLINPITYWVISTAAEYNAKLGEQGIDIKIAVNLSVYNLQEDNFINNITNSFKENNIPASKFIMEITESTIMTNPKKSIDILNKLNELGIEIAIDDFGTGYSSLTYLKKLPLSRLKIDKSFIMDMIDDDNDAMIVRSTIELAHNLGLSVVAEGIEQKEGMELLNILGCEQGQGYYISRPIEGNDFENWFIENNP